MSCETRHCRLEMMDDTPAYIRDVRVDATAQESRRRGYASQQLTTERSGLAQILVRQILLLCLTRSCSVAALQQRHRDGRSGLIWIVGEREPYQQSTPSLVIGIRPCRNYMSGLTNTQEAPSE